MRLGWVLLVPEPAAIAEPPLQDERRLVRRARLRGEPPCLLPERSIRPDQPVALVVEDPVGRRLAARRAEPGELCRPELEVAVGRRGVDRRRCGERAGRRSRRVAPDGVRPPAADGPVRHHHAAAQVRDPSQQRAVDAGRLRDGREPLVVEPHDGHLLLEPASGLRVSPRDERVGREAPPRQAAVDGVQVLDPAIAVERLQRRHPPVLRTFGSTYPEHHGRANGKVDPRVARVPQEADVRGAAAPGERIPAAPVDPRRPGSEPRCGDASGDQCDEGGQCDAVQAATRVTDAQHDGRPQNGAERRHAEPQRRGLFHEDGREADADRDRGRDDRRPAGRGAERRGEREAERRGYDEPVQRRKRRRVERRLHGGCVVQRAPRAVERPVRPRVERDGEGRGDRDGALPRHATPARERGTGRARASPSRRTLSTRPAPRAAPTRRPRRRRRVPRRARAGR